MTDKPEPPEEIYLNNEFAGCQDCGEAFWGKNIEGDVVKYVRADVAEQRQNLSYLQLSKIRQITGTEQVTLEGLADAVAMVLNHYKAKAEFWDIEVRAAAQRLATLGTSVGDFAESISLYLTEVYGERCDEFQPGCMTCNAWASYDDYKSDRALTELTQSSQDMGMYDHIGQVDKMISLEELKKETSQEP